MSLEPYGAAIAVALHVLVELALIVRVLLRPHRDPASRIAWIVVIVTLPGIMSIYSSISGCRTVTAARLSRR